MPIDKAAGNRENSNIDDISGLNSLNGKLKHEISERKRAEEELEQRNMLLSTLLDVSNLVSSTMELEPLLHSILDRLKTIIDYKGAGIFSVSGSSIKLFAHKNLLPSEREEEGFLAVGGTPLAQHVIRDRKPVVIADIYSDDAMSVSFRKTMTGYLDNVFKDTRSWIGLPMIIKDRVIGILMMDHSSPGYYNDYHIEFGTAFANQAAIEFENAKLYNETIKKADELRTMFTVQQAITSRLELDAVLTLIAEESRRLTNSYSTAVFLVDGGDLVFSVYSGGNYSKLIGHRLPVEKSIIGRKLLAGRSVILKDARSDFEAEQELFEKASAATLMCVPLLAGTKPVGIISAISKRFDAFDEEDERILNMFAPSAVIGIENASLYLEERRRHLEDEQRRYVAEGLREMLAILNSNRPIDEMLGFIVKEAARLMGTDTGALYSLTGDRSLLSLKAACGFPGNARDLCEIPYGDGPISRAAAERKPVVVTNPAALSGWKPESFGGLLALPLICKDEVYGGIALYFKKSGVLHGKTREFSKDEIDLAMAFADQAALAIDNARLRTQSEEMAVAAERNRIARDLHDAVTQTLFSASLIADVLPRIWEKKPEEGRSRLEELRQLTRGALAEMRSLLFELRPATLEKAPLPELLKQLADAAAGRGRLPVKLVTEGDPELPVEVKISFYRIAQEALNNIVKHSDATLAAVELKTDSVGLEARKKVSLAISDNGKGFDPGAVTGEHFGVGIMRERAEAAGAKLEVKANAGGGTVITINWISLC